MIKTINIILLLICIVLGYMLFQSISKPIKMQEQIETREEAVHAKLLKIRDAQDAYRNIHGVFSPTFDSLIEVMKNGQYTSVSRVTGDTIKFSVKDSIFHGNVEEINDLPNVPYSDGKKFEMDAGVLKSPNDSTLLVPVFEASTVTDDFLGGPNGIDPNYWKSGKKVKVGSMTAPILTGNWE